MNKKIFYVLPDLSVIGAQRLAIDYGKELQINGYSVSWCLGDLTGGFIRELDPRHILTFSVETLVNIRVIRHAERILRLALLLRKHKPDVVISITPFYNRIVCLFKFLNIISSRVVIEDHAYPPKSYIDEFSFLSRVIYKKTEFLYKYADRFRVLSPESKMYYDNILGNNASIFQINYLNIKRIESLSIDKEATLPTKEKPRVVYIGRFTTQKNIHFLIRSFSLLLKRLDADLFIIGYGPEEASLLKLIHELRIDSNVTILPSSEHNFANLKSANLFTMVSLWEGMGLVIAEAMALKVPVITTNFLAGPQFLIGRKNERGLIVRGGDEGLLAESMLNVLSGADRFTAERAKRAFSFVNDNIDIKANFKCYISKFISQ